jgi:hypothetical protein
MNRKTVLGQELDFGIMFGLLGVNPAYPLFFFAIFESENQFKMNTTKGSPFTLLRSSLSHAASHAVAHTRRTRGF